MCSKNAKAEPHLRFRLMRQATVTSGCVFLVATVIVMAVIYFHFTGRMAGLVSRVVTDLMAEYAPKQYGQVEKAFITHMEEDAAEHDISRFFVVLTDKDGALLYATPTPPAILQALLTAAVNGTDEQVERKLVSVGDLRRRAIRCRALQLMDGNRVVVGLDGTSQETIFFLVLAVLGGAFVLTTLLAGAGAYVFGSRLERRLAAIAEAAEEIAAGDWSRRVPLVGEVREIEKLITLFNRMCDRNEHTLNELRVLTDNIAHDLRTPLTRLALAAETESAAPKGTKPHALADTVTEETTAMLDMIDVMLEISRTDAKIESSPRQELDLAALVAETVSFFDSLATEKGVELTCEGTQSGAVLYSGHRAKFQRLLGNLTENAVKFTSKGGRIVWRVKRRAEGGVELAITDTGCGIAADDLPHIFTRFWRADSSRHFPGNGLGLALVKAIATSYGGTVTCTSILGAGTTFTVRLP